MVAAPRLPRRSRLRARALAAGIGLCALVAVALSPSHAVAISYSGQLHITIFGGGTGVVTDDWNELDCSYSGVSQTGTCDATYDFVGTDGTITLIFTPGLGSYACLEGGCGAVNVAWKDPIYLQNGDNFTLSPDFEAAPEVSLAVTVKGPVGNHVDFAGMTCGAGTTCTTTLPPGAKVTLQSVSNVVSVLSGWTGPCTGQPYICTFTITTNTKVTATFVDTSATASPAAGPTKRPSPSSGTRPPTTPAPTGPQPSTATQSTSAPGSAAPAAIPSAPTNAGSDATPWLPILVLAVILVGGINLIVWQVLRARR